jgi:hypothetical protein
MIIGEVGRNCGRGEGGGGEEKWGDNYKTKKEDYK